MRDKDFIEVLDSRGDKVLINIYDVAYVFKSQRSYCTIVLKTGAITIDTGQSYEVVKRLLMGE